MISRATPLLLMVLLLVSGSAWAQKTGVQLYENGEYEEAVRLFTQELEEAQRPAEERALARIYLASSLHAMGQVEEARRHLEVLAREHPGQRVDPVLFPPEFVALAEVIRQQVESEQQFAVREAQLQKEREEALRRTPPTTPLYLRPEALGLFDAVAREWTVGAGVSFRRESLEGTLRVLVGNPPAFHLQGGFLPDRGDWRPFLGARASLIPGLASYGAGPVVGGRVALPWGLVGVLDVGADYFFAGRDDRYRFAITAQAGIGFDVRLQ
jgi:tetratricopeptide (TPR) repeat protein